MSLAPGQQRALARIEEDLRRRDPRLDAMLAAFTTTRTSRLAWRWCRIASSRPGWPAITAMLAAAIAVIILGGVLADHIGAAVCWWLAAGIPLALIWCALARHSPPGRR